MRRSFIHFEQLKTINGTDIITVGQNKGHRQTRKETHKRITQTNRESLLLLQLEEISFASPALKGWGVPRPFPYPKTTDAIRSKETDRILWARAHRAKSSELDYAWTLSTDMDFGRGSDSRPLHR